MFIVSALSNMGDMKSGVLRSKNATILQVRRANALFCSNMRNSNYPHRHVNAMALYVFVTATVKLQKFVVSKPNFSSSKQDSDRQHQLRLSSLYP